MKNSSSQVKYLFLLLAITITIILVALFFLVGASSLGADMKSFLQGISGNIIATTISFIILYMFIESKGLLEETSYNHSETVSFLKNIEDAVVYHDRTGEIDRKMNYNWLWQAYEEKLGTDFLKFLSDQKSIKEILESIMNESVNSDEIKERYEITQENTSLRIEIASTQEKLNSALTKVEEYKAELTEKTKEIQEQRKYSLEIRQEISNLNNTVQDIKQQVESNASGQIVLASQASQEKLWYALIPNIRKVEELSKSVDEIAARVSMIDQ
jgi:archaellum component FlaC